MAWIKWTSTMSVGLASLDHDHQVLVSLINRLEEAPTDARASSDLVREIVDSLLRYTVFHFNREEAVIRACDYPDADAHYHEHRLLTREVGELQRRANINAISREEVALFLVDLLNHHILLQDMHYRAYIEGDPRAEKAAICYGEFGAGDMRTAAALLN